MSMQEFQQFYLALNKTLIDKNDKHFTNLGKTRHKLSARGFLGLFGN